MILAGTLAHMTVGIVGLGLIGGSIGLALRKPGNRVLGYEPRGASGDVALSRQCIDALVSIEEASACDVVFVAAPPSAVIECLDTVFRHVSATTVVTDCASVKGEVAAWSNQRRHPRFVPGHPMAGHEKSGAGYASGWLFRHAKWILCPSRQTDRPSLKFLENVIKEIGAVPIRMDAEEHDRQISILSHLPHALAAVMVRMAGELENTEASAGSWKDLTRVGGVDPFLWADIMIGNRQELSRTLQAAIDDLSKLNMALQENDRDAVQHYLWEARDAKAKHEPTRPSPAPKGTKRKH